MGIPPLFWGWRFWNFFHYLCICLDAALNQSTSFLTLQGVAEFFRAFGRLLPCFDCSNHMLAALQQDFNPVEKRWPSQGYFAWSVELRARIAKRVNRKEKMVAEALPLYNAEWKANSWGVLFLMGFSYPTTNMTTSFFDDVDFFFRLLPRLVPTTFHPEIFNSVLDRRPKVGPAPAPSPKDWCLTKTSFLETLFELRQAHAKVYFLPAAASLDDLQQQWIHDLEAFVTEYRIRHERDLKEQAEKRAAEVKVATEETKDDEKEDDEPVKVRKVKPVRTLISLQDLRMQQKQKKKEKEKEKERSEGKEEERGGGKEKEIVTDSVHQTAADESDKSISVPDPIPAPVPVPVPIPIPIAIHTPQLSIPFIPSNRSVPSTAKELSVSVPATIAEDIYPETINLYEDEVTGVITNQNNSNDYNDVQKPFQFEDEVSDMNLIQTTEHSKSKSKNKKKDGFQFSFNGKDWTASYWIIWVILLFLAILLIGLGAAWSMRKSYVKVTVDEEPALANEEPVLMNEETVVAE
jgi:hypothetical protein